MGYFPQERYLPQAEDCGKEQLERITRASPARYSNLIEESGKQVFRLPRTKDGSYIFLQCQFTENKERRPTPFALRKKMSLFWPPKCTVC